MKENLSKILMLTYGRACSRSAKQASLLSTHLIAAFMALPIALGLASCSDDNSVDDYDETYIPDEPNLLAEEAVGVWWAESYAIGTTPTGDAYNRIGHALRLNANGTGYGVTFYFGSNSNDPIEVMGGQDIAPFNYQVADDGTISLNFITGYEPDEERFKAVTYCYADDHITATDGADTYQFARATDAQVGDITEWDLAANGGDDSEQRSIIENSGRLYSYEFNVSLNNKIDKGTGSSPNYLKADGKISLDLRVIPIYMQSSNEDKAGDYYFVTCALTPHNNSLWQPYVERHGGTKIRIYGYWFKDMNLNVSLVNEDGTPVDGLQYYQRPVPENKNDSRTYSNGKNISLSGTVSGGYTNTTNNKGWNVGGSFSVGATWTSSVNYTLETINFTLDSSSPTVKYNYYSENVKLTDDWSKMDQYFPKACHSEFTGHSCWVWFVPYDKSGVRDGSTNKFRIKASIDGHYSSWYHWRWTKEFSDNRVDYEVKFDTGDGDLLDAPERRPWGIVALKNAANNEMSHVRFFKQGADLDGTPEVQLTGSYSKNQVVKQSLLEGTYTVVYDAINGDTNKNLGTWKIENIKVHQGRDEASATTDVSTVDAVKK